MVLRYDILYRRILPTDNLLFSSFRLVNPEESTLEEWLQLPLKSVESYLCADDLEVRSEKVVLEACLAWVAHEPEKRICHLTDLLHHVRLQQLSPGLLRTYIESDSSIIRVSIKFNLFHLILCIMIQNFVIKCLYWPLVLLAHENLKKVL